LRKNGKPGSKKTKMNTINPNAIYVVDDDEDDEMILREVVQDLGLKNEVIFFHTGEALLQRLMTNEHVPFLIISSVNLPGISGFDLRRKLLDDPNIIDKTIPFIFWAENASESQVKQAYSLSAHGFFIKGGNYQQVRDELAEIISYWSMSLAPQ
jgi:CheY-like chemotaxis protein